MNRLALILAIALCMLNVHNAATAENNKATVTHSVDTYGRTVLQVINESGSDLATITYRQTGPGIYVTENAAVLQPAQCDAPDTCGEYGNELFIYLAPGTYTIALATMYGAVYRETITVDIASGEMVRIQYEGDA